MIMYTEDEVNALKGRLDFWEKEAGMHRDAAEYYQKQLVDAHALLGRVIHQYSERWDTINLTQYFPTDNAYRRRSVANPSGEKK